MAFLTKTELKTRTHLEIINAIIKNDDTIIDMIISESITYMKGFLRARFDVDVVFDKTGNDRDQVVLKILKDIVIYEIYSSHNPAMMTKVVQDNHDRAQKWLKEVQKENINPDLTKRTDEGINYIAYGSNTKRSSHY